jgi:predicted SAM-dependent methyltransferase
MKKLHLGCGDKRLEGYINVDIRKTDATDIVCDVKNLNFEEESFDLIYNCAVLEHLMRGEWFNVLKGWSKLLKKGGKIYTSTTDFEAVCKRYEKAKNVEELLGFLVGGQKFPYDHHGMVFDFKVLEGAFLKLGFKNIQRFDWRKFDTGLQGLDDYSQAYLPHMDKENGQLMVLNIVAEKC